MHRSGRIVVATDGEWPEEAPLTAVVSWTPPAASHVEVCRLGHGSWQMTPAWLAEHVRETGAQLVVVPARGSLRGTVAAQAVRAVVVDGLCPVLVSRPLLDPGRVLLAGRLEDLRLPAIEVPASQPDVELWWFAAPEEYLHTLGFPAELARWRERDRQRVRSLHEARLGRLLRVLGMRGEIVVVSIRAGREVRAEALRIDARLIVMGLTRRRSFFGGLRESPEETLALDAPCPVLLVPVAAPVAGGER